MRCQGWLCTAASAFAAVAFMTVPATAAQAASVPAVGFNDARSDGILLPYAKYDGLKDLDLASGSGATLYRARVRLDCVDPAGTGTYDFTTRSLRCYGLSYDELVRALAVRRISLLPALMNFKRSAVGGSESPLAPTRDGAGGTPTYAQFAAFAAAAARRYGPDGTFWATCDCPAQPVRSWQIWNEQNNGWWWNGTASPTEYADLFRQTRAALRAADPQARAVVGGLTFDHAGHHYVEPEEFITALGKDDANAFDAVGLHPYTDARGKTGEQLADDVLALTRRLADHVVRTTGPSPTGGPRQPLWITETGWSTYDAAPETIAAGLASLVQRLDAGVRARDNVGPVIWFMLRDSHVKLHRDDQLGMRETTGTGADAGAKPVWDVFTDAAARTPHVDAPPALTDAGAPYVAPAPAKAVEVVAPPAVDTAVAPRPVALPAPSVDGPAPLATRTRSSRRCRGANRAPRRTTARTARAAVLCLIDAERARRGLRPLRSARKLSALAARRATQAARGRGRASGSGVFVTTRRGIAPSPRAVVSSWLRNRTRRATLLAAHPQVGVAVVVGPRRSAYALGLGSSR